MLEKSIPTAEARSLPVAPVTYGPVVDPSFGPDARDGKNQIRVEQYLRKKYSLRYNIVKGLVEWFNKTTERFEPMTDYAENSILRNIRTVGGISCDQTLLRAILNSDYCPVYDPFSAYFKSLRLWDEKADYIKALADTVVTTKPDFWYICFRKWLVAMVACALDKKATNHTVITLSGKQGLGKTRWIEKLVPPELKVYLFSGTVNPTNKDTLIHLAECLLINLDELENLNRAEVGALKELITKSQINFRRPYGRNTEVLPRRASFIGSVNNAQFLNDTTGSRRFLCFEVKDIDTNTEELVENALSQAYNLYKKGFQFWFDQTEIAEINSNNEQYQINTTEEEMIQTYFEKGDINHAQLYLNASQVIHRLNEKGVRLPMQQVSMGKAFKKLGFERVKRGGMYVYALNERPIVKSNAAHYQGVNGLEIVDGLNSRLIDS